MNGHNGSMTRARWKIDKIFGFQSIKGHEREIAGTRDGRWRPKISADTRLGRDYATWPVARIHPRIYQLLCIAALTSVILITSVMHTATPTRPRVSAVAYLPARPPLIPAGLSRIRFHEMEIRSDRRR